MVRRYPTVPLIKINLEYRKLSPVVGIQINSISPARELSMVFFFFVIGMQINICLA
jgi:hypothetical protein